MTPRWEIIGEPIYQVTDDDNFSLVMGKFDDFPALGICWDRHCRNAPLVLEKNVETILITGLLQQAISNGKQEDIEKFMRVIRFLNSTPNNE